MRLKRAVVLAGVTAAIVIGTGWRPALRAVARQEDGYNMLLKLFREFREFQKPAVSESGVPDYTAAAMAAQKARIPEYVKRLAAIDNRGWPISRRVDYEIVKAEIHGLEFDHRVLRPWSRAPGFYAVIQNSEPDVPAREGAEIYGCLNLWEYTFPLDAKSEAMLLKKLSAIPQILAQARANLVEDPGDLWRLGERKKAAEIVSLDRLAERLSTTHPNLAERAKLAREAVAVFRSWLIGRMRTFKGSASAGIGKAEYDWYQANVHLVPYTWEEQFRLAKRELERSLAFLKLEEHRNRSFPLLQPPATREEWQQRQAEAANGLLEFLRKNEIFTVEDSMRLPAGGGNLIPPERRDIFTQVDYRNAFPLKTHAIHWLEKQRESRNTHPIRGTALLYNIWDSRAEGFATAAEEIMMQAGLLDTNPRARELVYVLLAFRAVRAMCDLKLHSREWTLDDAIKFAVEATPFGWLKADGDTIWTDLNIYLHGPGYGTSYLTGKIQIEGLMADYARSRGHAFTLKGFLDEMFSKGLIPASLIRWEMTGLEDEMNRIWKSAR